MVKIGETPPLLGFRAPRKAFRIGNCVQLDGATIGAAAGLCQLRNGRSLARAVATEIVLHGRKTGL
jgi:hypothetical protein